jgi:hypothetical protein|tara:strand:- start:317 stop:466 length:150 start_codon:yes stop_codon:yes gene_type:complete
MAIGSVTSDGRGTVSEGPGSVGTRVMDKDYPYTEGLTAGNTKQTKKPNL